LEGGKQGGAKKKQVRSYRERPTHTDVGVGRPSENLVYIERQRKRERHTVNRVNAEHKKTTGFKAKGPWVGGVVKVRVGTKGRGKTTGNFSGGYEGYAKNSRQCMDSRGKQGRARGTEPGKGV